MKNISKENRHPGTTHSLIDHTQKKGDQNSIIGVLLLQAIAFFLKGHSFSVKVPLCWCSTKTVSLGLPNYGQEKSATLSISFCILHVLRSWGLLILHSLQKKCNTWIMKFDEPSKLCCWSPASIHTVLVRIMRAYIQLQCIFSVHFWPIQQAQCSLAFSYLPLNVKWIGNTAWAWDISQLFSY